jgi:hypothetical protein
VRIVLEGGDVMKRSAELLLGFGLATSMSYGMTADGAQKAEPVQHEIRAVNCKVHPSAIATVVFNPKNRVLDYLGDAIREPDGHLKWIDQTQVETYPSKHYFSITADGYGPIYGDNSKAEPEQVAFSDSHNGSRVTVQQVVINATSHIAADIVRYYCS